MADDVKRYALKFTPTPTGRKVDYAAELNDQQLAVVNAADGPILVIAGAGSGKTRTVTYRVARLIESGVPAPQILLVTFTNKAAREMVRRVEGLIQADVRQVWGGTFHHAGNMILRRHAPLLGYHENFTILDREDAKELVNQIVAGKKSLMKFKKFPKGDVIEEILSLSINTQQPLGTVINEDYPVFLEIADEIARVCDEYRQRKRALGLMDFDDLLVNWRKLVVEHGDVRDRYHKQFRHILVDEYQDTNRLQAEIVETIAGPGGNLMVVGDDAQSIYSFRGANFGNIIDFPRRFPDAKVFKLETNYRSTPQILALANSSIEHNARQFRKVLRTSRVGGPKPEVVSAGNAQEQSQFVVERILELRDEGMDLNDCAVLYRAHWHSMEIQMELTTRGIPFQVRSGLRFFEQAHVKDVAAYLKIVSNPRDEISWKRVLKMHRGIGRSIADKIWNEVVKAGDPVAWIACDDARKLVPMKAKEGWKDFVKLVKELAPEAMRKSPGDSVRAVLDGGYADYLAANYANAQARAEDLARLADFAVRFKSVEEFLSELALNQAVVSEEVVDEYEDTEVLVLSTVHQAKGLEWRAVFLIWLVDGKLPDGRALREDGGEEEERRLFYVACTRAKDRLYLVHPVIGDERGMFGVIQRPSRFVSELDAKTFDRAIAEVERPDQDDNT